MRRLVALGDLERHRHLAARALRTRSDEAKTYVLDDIVVCVLAGVGFTPLEKTMMDSGEPERIVAMREDFQRVMDGRYTELIEELTGRKVLAFLSQVHVEPDTTLEMFFIDRALDGYGAVEATAAGHHRACGRQARRLRHALGKA